MVNMGDDGKEQSAVDTKYKSKDFEVMPQPSTAQEHHSPQKQETLRMQKQFQRSAPRPDVQKSPERPQASSPLARTQSPSLETEHQKIVEVPVEKVVERFIPIEVPVEKRIEVPIEWNGPNPAIAANETALRTENNALAARIAALEAENRCHIDAAASAAVALRAQEERAASLAAELAALRTARDERQTADAAELERLRSLVAALQADLQRGYSAASPASPDAIASGQVDLESGGLTNPDECASVTGASSPDNGVRAQSPIARRNKWSGRRTPLSAATQF